MVLFHSEGVVGGLWIPQVVEKRGFKYNLPYATKLVEGDNVKLDKTTILSEIARLGGDMVVNIETH